MMDGMPRTLRSLLLALTLVAVCVPTLAVAAESERVSRIRDPRITESSGLVISTEYRNLAYTINDAGSEPIVYAIKISTGRVVGTTRVGGGVIGDTEAIAIDGDGTMWVADLGDNDEVRRDTALYALPEPGRGNHSVTAKRYPVSYKGGPVDVEAFLVHPKTGMKFLASREKAKRGTLYSLPKKLSVNGDNRATDLDKAFPVDVTDATFTVDGSQTLIRTPGAVHVFDPKTWSEVEVLSVPEVKLGQSIAMEPDGTSFIIGSEGKNSPLIRVAFGTQTTAEPTPTPTPTSKSDEVLAKGVGIPVVAVVGIAAMGVLALVAVWAVFPRKEI
jgi:hypothetical protein